MNEHLLSKLERTAKMEIYATALEISFTHGVCVFASLTVVRRRESRGGKFLVLGRFPEVPANIIEFPRRFPTGH